MSERLYPGPFSLTDGKTFRHRIAVDDDGHYWAVADDGPQRLGGWGYHPLANQTGLLLLQILMSMDALWRSLSRAQRRCIEDPTTRTTRPWAVLVTKGLASTDGALTDFGHFLLISASGLRPPAAEGGA